jgi:UDP-glucose 4-epimerase
MRLFITGGTGFIGSYVLRAALSAGHKVRALRSSEDSKPSIALPSDPEWISGTLGALTADQIDGSDAVIHLATAGVSPKRVPWDELVKTNIAGSIRVLEMGKQAGLRRFVVAGTSHEYGQSANRFNRIPPDAPLEPLNLYGASKAAAFQMLRAFAIEHGLELFYGRLFTAYGEGQYAQNFWPSLKAAALSGVDFPMSSGRQVNDFLPVERVADHLLKACNRADISAGKPLVVNIGSGQSSSLLEFAEREWRQFGAKGKLLPSSFKDRSDQMYHCVPDLKNLNPSHPSCNQA